MIESVNLAFAAAALIVAAGVLVALADWRYGFHASVVVAIFQDALRKLVPGQPVVFVIFVGIVFAATCLSAYARGVPLTPRSIDGWRKYLRAPFSIFVAILVVQAVQGFARTGSILVPAIGLLSYLAPIPAILIGYQMAVRGNEAQIRKVLLFYVLCAAAALSTAYLQYVGIDWPVLGDVGENLLIFDKYSGVIVQGMAGVFRSSEVAAWHAAACVCVLLLLSTYRRLSAPQLIVTIVSIIAVLVIGSLTGRRKLFIEVAIFGATFAILLFIFKGRALKLVGAAVSVAAIGYGAFWLGLGPNSGDPSRAPEYDIYVSRGSSVFGDAPNRLQELGLGQLVSAYNATGVMGAGLGLGSQGSQYFGADDDQTRGAAEGGLGKIVLELGALGLTVAVWFAVSLLRLVWRGLRLTARLSPRLSRLSFGLVGFLAANVAAFTVATQVFGDLFILLMLGVCLGFLLAIPVLATREAEASRAELYRRNQSYMTDRRAAA